MKPVVLIFPDKASQNIKQHLHPSIQTHFVKKRCVDAEDIDKEIDADLFIFATTHSSKSGIPSLSVHPIGNFSEAEVGGKPKALVPCDAGVLRDAFLKLKELNNLEDYETILECTHHGPYLEKPSIFVEIGSNEERWEDPKAGKIIAELISHIIAKSSKKTKTISAIGFGGLHTCPEISKVLTRSAISIGHVCPKYNLEALDKEMVQQMIQQTIPTPELAILDWKGLGQYKEKILHLLKEFNLPYKKTTDYKSS
jgi:D-aminoacyl-tRNA deacylase